MLTLINKSEYTVALGPAYGLCTRGQCSMYGISILSLVSTASLRNWSVFLFLEEGKENSVSLGHRCGLGATLFTQPREEGLTSSDAGLTTAVTPSRAAGLLSAAVLALLGLASWGQLLGPEFLDP